MTRMIPPTIHSSVESKAERRIYKKIRGSEGSDDWTCLHSLGLARHAHKRRAEIDFLVICPDGVFVLEVKGGRVRRKQGSWTFTNSEGEENTKNEGPFDQASTAMFALEKRLKTLVKDVRINDVLFGYGVVFPDIEYDVVGCEDDPALVYDARDLRRPFRDYLNSLIEFTRSCQTRTRKRLSLGDAQRICDALRGDFDLRPIPDLELDETRESIAQLTIDQRSVLDAAEHSPRLIVDGPAGSGKTILAMEAARREARNGRRVLFLCFNRLLAARIRGDLRVEPYAGKIEVETLAAHCRTLIEQSTLLPQFEREVQGVDDDTRYRKLLPEYAALAAMEKTAPAYDCLVIDEAQDVLSAGLAELLSEELHGGIDLGQWRIFLDSNNQASVYGALDDQVLERLHRESNKRVDLNLNCRNTRQIAIQTNIVAEPANRANALVEGCAVDFQKYSSDSQRGLELGSIISRLGEEGVTPGRVSILFVRRPSREDEAVLRECGIKQLSDSDVGDLGTRRLTTITWTTVSAFKGLENDVVVLVGVHDIEKDWWRSVTYVGMSRARVRLSVIVHSKCDATRMKRFEKELKRRMDAKEMIA